jgi:DNA-binding SARP family transcriptional activator
MSEPVAQHFELQVLGPVRLLLAGRPQPLKTRKALALLLLVVLEGDLSRSRLCAWLWPGQDESGARRNLRRELVRLREDGAAEALRVEGDRLRTGPGLVCDLTRAEVLLAGGEPDAALALWRGEAVDGLAAEGDEDAGFAPWLDTLRQRVQSLRRGSLEASASAAEARGDLPRALQRVQALLQDDSLQERYHRDAMRLLAATGQREEALRQFESCRALLAAELGLQPLPQTLTLASSLRQGPAEAAAPVPVPSTAAPSRPDHAVQLPPQLPFVGREAEVAQLQRAWGRRQSMLLVGPAGVGKTRLAIDFAAAQGPYALLRCQPGDHELPFGAFARALRVLAGQPPDLAALEPWVVAELARLLPELGPTPPPLRNDNERLRFDEACVRAWRALAGEAFDAVVLDDWQLADPGSRSLLARVAARRREQGGAGAIELLAWRGELDDPELQTSAEALGAETLALGALPEAAVHELVRQLSGAAAPTRFAQRLRSATGGHPYFIAETLRDLAERALLRGDAQGRWHTPFDEQTEDYHELPLPASVRDAVLARVRRLGVPAVRLLEAAALAGEPLGAAWLAQACALSELEAVQALEQAAQAQLVLARDGGGYAWAHDLARLALVSALTPTRHRLLHHRLALAAEAAGARVEAACHFEACGEPARAVPHRLAAGDAALALQALSEAAAQWRQGLADAPAPADEAALAARLGEVEWLQGQHAQAQAYYQRLLPWLAERGIDAAARTDLQLRAARYLVLSSKPADAMALLDMMAVPDEPALRLRWWTLHMRAQTLAGRLDEALDEGRHAIAASAPNTLDRAEVLATMWQVALGHGRLRDAADYADACLDIFTRLGDALGRARGLFYRATSSIELGETGNAEADLLAAAQLAGQHGNVYLQRAASYNLAVMYATDQSRPALALAVLREAWPALTDAPLEDAAVMYRGLVLECQFQLGEWGLMWASLVPTADGALARQDVQTMLSVANCVAEPAAMLGQWPRIAPLVQALEEGGALNDVPSAADMILACASAALVRGELATAAGWLVRVQQAGEAEHPRVRCRAALLRAELGVLQGRGPQALLGVPPDNAPGMNPELRLRALLTRWRGGGVTRAQALEAAAAPSAHAGLALLLARELGGEVFVSQRQRLADSLVSWPELRSSFLATWV